LGRVIEVFRRFPRRLGSGGLPPALALIGAARLGGLDEIDRGEFAQVVADRARRFVDDLAELSRRLRAVLAQDAEEPGSGARARAWRPPSRVEKRSDRQRSYPQR
jgi:hypothetical protein